MTPADIAARIVRLADQLGWDNPEAVRADLHDLARDVLADAPETQAVAERLATVTPISAQPAVPAPLDPQGWDVQVTPIPTREALGRKAGFELFARCGSRVQRTQGLSYAEVERFLPQDRWLYGMALRRKGR